MSRIEIHISASIPAGNEELGHEAVVAAKAPVNAVVDALTALGLTDVKKEIHLRRNRTKADSGVPATNSVPAGVIAGVDPNAVNDEAPKPDPHSPDEY